MIQSIAETYVRCDSTPSAIVAHPTAFGIRVSHITGFGGSLGSAPGVASRGHKLYCRKDMKREPTMENERPALQGRRVFLSAEWRDLAILNYEVDPALLKAYVPHGTEPDSYRGRTFL